jgi:hypothetical protein
MKCACKTFVGHFLWLDKVKLQDRENGSDKQANLVSSACSTKPMWDLMHHLLQQSRTDQFCFLIVDVVLVRDSLEERSTT